MIGQSATGQVGSTNHRRVSMIYTLVLPSKKRLIRLECFFVHWLFSGATSTCDSQGHEIYNLSEKELLYKQRIGLELLEVANRIIIVIVVIIIIIIVIIISSLQVMSLIPNYTTVARDCLALVGCHLHLAQTEEGRRVLYVFLGFDFYSECDAFLQSLEPMDTFLSSDCCDWLTEKNPYAVFE